MRGRCYRNAFLSVASDPSRYAYVEGYCLSGSFPIAHTWFVDRERPHLALDTTLPWSEPYRYAGVCLRFDYVNAIVAKRGVYGSAIAWYEEWYPILTGVHPPESFLDILSTGGTKADPVPDREGCDLPLDTAGPSCT
jgi:hypothetical protein